jgi:hypothetical protein
MERNTSITFKIRLLAKTDGQEAGFIQLWKDKGKIQSGREIPFDHLADIPHKIERMLRRAKIDWPKKRSK